MLAVLSVSLLVVATTRSSEDFQACDPITGTFSHRDRESIFHIYSCGVDAARPVGVLVHLHGDGAGEFVGPEDPEGTLNSLARAGGSPKQPLTSQVSRRRLMAALFSPMTMA